MIPAEGLKNEINSVMSLFKNGNVQEALNYAIVLIETYPNEALLFNICGACFASLSQFDDAVENYKKALSINPNYSKAHFNLAGTLQDLGKLDEAVKSYESAIQIDPNHAEAFNNLGNIFKDLNQNNAAIECYEKALALNPNYIEVLYSLGIIFQNLGQIQQAVKHYRSLLNIKPNFSQIHYRLGTALQELGQLNDSIISYQAAIAIKPDFFEAFNNLGNLFKELNQNDDAIKSYKKALSINPVSADIHYNLGNLFSSIGEMNEAKKYYKKTLAIKPNYVEAYNNLGNIYKSLGQHDDSINCFNKALSIKPNHADSHNNLGNVLVELGQIVGACKSYNNAIDIEPNHAESHNNLGIAYFKLGQLNLASRHYKIAININSNYADAYANLGLVMKDLGEYDKADKSYESAIALDPNLDYILGNFLHNKMHACIWDNLLKYFNELVLQINSQQRAINPFSLLALIDNPELQRKTSETYIDHNHPLRNLGTKIKHYPGHEKIRIGYFSADFREHPVSDLTAELYEIHDRDKFEIYAFSYGKETQDKMSLRIKAGVDYFHDVYKMSFEEVVILSRSFEIDIAIDLGGLTADSRIELFAMSVAPIQVSYIGYLGTMGAKYYDYLIADTTIIPEKNQKYYTEKIAYLPCFQVNDSKQVAPKKLFTRNDIGLPKKGFIFCCFNNTFKITPSSFDSWARILGQVSDSVLLIYADNEIAKRNLNKEIIKRGINSNRLIFGKRLPKSDYLARYRVADLFLDTHPYNAGTTASDALRMGLPILTYSGDSFSSRIASSLLNAINLPELIATSQDHYEALAIELALNPGKFKIIKDKLLDNLSTSELYDTALFTQNIESAYTQMYERHQNKLEPDHIYAKPFIS